MLSRSENSGVRAHVMVIADTTAVLLTYWLLAIGLLKANVDGESEGNTFTE